MHIKPLIGLIAMAAIGVAACGSSGKYTTPAPPAAAVQAPAPTTASPYQPPTTAATPASTPTTTAAPHTSVTLADSTLGKILVDSDGRTLYAFTNDTDGTSTCTGACAKAWPAATITGDPVAGPGTTAALSVVDAPGGGKMLKAGKWPLYRFSGDAAAGDTNGQGSGGVWFVVGADGKLIKG